MLKHPLPRHLTWIALKQSIWKSIDYVLPATTLTRTEAYTLAKELYRPLLPRLGYNRNFPLLLQYNPTSLLGLGLHDPYLKQGLHKLSMLLANGGLETITGKLLQTSFEHLTLDVGSFTPLFSLSYLISFLSPHHGSQCYGNLSVNIFSSLILPNSYYLQAATMTAQ